MIKRQCFRATSGWSSPPSAHSTWSTKRAPSLTSLGIPAASASAFYLAEPRPAPGKTFNLAARSLLLSAFATSLLSPTSTLLPTSLLPPLAPTHPLSSSAASPSAPMTPRLMFLFFYLPSYLVKFASMDHRNSGYSCGLGMEVS